MYLLVQILSFVVRHLPEFALKGICVLFGELLYRLPGKARIVMSNLAHARPELEIRELRQLARTNCRRLIEMGLFALYSPSVGRAEIEKRVTLTPEFEEVFHRLEGQDPVLALLPHNTLSEMMTFSPMLLRLKRNQAAAVYRPLNQARLDRWIRETRERMGLRLLSRRAGLESSVQHLREGGYLAILADQSAGKAGILGRVAGRTASLSPLPDLLLKRSGARLVFVTIERTGFFRGRIKVHIPEPSNKEPTAQFADWLGKQLVSQEKWTTDWLWMHKRWKSHRNPSERLHLSQKRGFVSDFYPIPADRSRADRFIIRLPNWLGDIVMTTPLIRAIRKGRPDVHITLACRPSFEPLIDILDLPHDDLLLADSRQPEGLQHYKTQRARFPDTAIVFTNSFRADREVKLTGAEQRFGILRRGKSRPLLTHAWNLPEDLDEQSIHQLELFGRFLAHFGLTEKPDLTPVSGWSGSHAAQVGMICGSENAPEKRWPIASWRTLVAKLLESDPGLQIELYGTAGDADLSAKIAAGFGDAVTNLAGETNLAELGEHLRKCRTVIGNDTGGIHLANALGVPTFILFGPTNPIRTAPVFDAPAHILQSSNAAPTGGGTMEGIAVDDVFEAVLAMVRSLSPERP